MKYSDFDQRMKKYEKCNTNISLTPRCPVIIRLDGKAFHTYTKAFKDKNSSDPFSLLLREAFSEAVLSTIKNVSGVKAVYFQSDEVSFWLTDEGKSTDTQGWFDFKLQKMISVISSVFTYYFNGFINHPDGMPAFFDARVFSLPNVVEVENYFIWRQQDASRNSVSMLAQHHFSHKKLQGASRVKMQDLLMNEKNINWNDLDTWKKRGSLVIKKQERRSVFNQFMKTNEEKIVSRFVDIECPIFTQDKISTIIDNNLIT